MRYVIAFAERPFHLGSVTHEVSILRKTDLRYNPLIWLSITSGSFTRQPVRRRALLSREFGFLSRDTNKHRVSFNVRTDTGPRCRARTYNFLLVRETRFQLRQSWICNRCGFNHIPHTAPSNLCYRVITKSLM